MKIEQESAIGFIKQALQLDISPDESFHSICKDGVLLCRLINKFSPGAIPKISLKEFPFLQIENLNMFIAACQDYGVAPNELFAAFEFYEGTNIENAIECVLALERQVKAGEKLYQRRLQKDIMTPTPKSTSSSQLKQSIVSPDAQSSPQQQISQKSNSNTFDGSLNDLSHDFASLAKQEQTESNLRAVMIFIEQTLGEPLPTHDLFECLRNGIILCRLMNILSPNSVPVITNKKHPYQQMQNIFNFLNAARNYGVKSAELFQSSDLFEGRDMQQVVVTLTSLARISSRYKLKEAKLIEKNSSVFNNFRKAPSEPSSLSSNQQTNIEEKSQKKEKRKNSKPRLKSDNVLTEDNVKGLELVVPDFKGTDTQEYIFGNCIGRGQYGAVFKGLNLSTGATVAIKRIPFNDATTKELATMMKEVDLLKSLSHTNIVKYEGFLQQNGYLNIILEYVENGSLYHTMKQFGSFPEKLVAVYVTGILQGLSYLHGRNVVHCDLKSANILTTKSGTVKLSDFGVSKEFSFEADNAVAGTPNWMAPEIIELKGANTLSDIWSLGCTIIELVTGKPPYYECNPMTALFKIVEEEMPVPEGISVDLHDFLVCCFAKDSEKRPPARVLQHHKWLKRFKPKSDASIPSSYTDSPDFKDEARLRSFRTKKHHQGGRSFSTPTSSSSSLQKSSKASLAISNGTPDTKKDNCVIS